jgi:hypothetical protein
MTALRLGAKSLGFPGVFRDLDLDARRCRAPGRPIASDYGDRLLLDYPVVAVPHVVQLELIESSDVAPLSPAAQPAVIALLAQGLWVSSSLGIVLRPFPGHLPKRPLNGFY